jgi:hypothetical protein
MAKIQLRRDTTVNWESVDPILADGEQGYEKDTGKLKIGDGSTVWTLLPYLVGDGGASDVQYTTLNDYVTDATMFRGDAVLGGSPAPVTSAAVWRIQKILTPVDTEPTILYPNGDPSFTYVWDDRLTYTYS